LFPFKAAQPELSCASSDLSVNGVGIGVLTWYGVGAVWCVTSESVTHHYTSRHITTHHDQHCFHYVLPIGYELGCMLYSLLSFFAAFAVTDLSANYYNTCCYCKARCYKTCCYRDKTVAYLGLRHMSYCYKDPLLAGIRRERNRCRYE
jgi:hypothetical protein